ncbi:uncharacterized protein TEOVI_000164000 [Trypanosoma equiperdum]|uniref:Uncharacterized protein n=1 Tax=Trypanosoma equiperdum TaxID=5694 RepID=A0A1G4ICQ8_TRYEQ|nr:hypothetical protein TEOVI_000164000 [Trypanosoma equiperdum]
MAARRHRRHHHHTAAHAQKLVTPKSSLSPTVAQHQHEGRKATYEHQNTPFGVNPPTAATPEVQSTGVAPTVNSTAFKLETALMPPKSLDEAHRPGVAKFSDGIDPKSRSVTDKERGTVGTKTTGHQQLGMHCKPTTEVSDDASKLVAEAKKKTEPTAQGAPGDAVPTSKT